MLPRNKQIFCLLPGYSVRIYKGSAHTTCFRSPVLDTRPATIYTPLNFTDKDPRSWNLIHGLQTFTLVMEGTVLASVLHHTGSSCRTHSHRRKRPYFHQPGRQQIQEQIQLAVNGVQLPACASPGLSRPQLPTPFLLLLSGWTVHSFHKHLSTYSYMVNSIFNFYPQGVNLCSFMSINLMRVTKCCNSSSTSAFLFSLTWPLGTVLSIN